MQKIIPLLLYSCSFLCGSFIFAQEKRIIQIEQAGSFGKDEDNFPGANILSSTDGIRVKLFHEGALIESDKSLFYPKINAFKAEGNVIFTQGDTLRMTSQHMQYSGETGKAKAWGKVFLKQPDMSLETDTLYLNRREDLAYYETPGTVIDSSSTLKSNRGKYFMNEKKYQFISNVRIDNPEYTVNSSQLDYYTQTNKALFFGPTRIIGKDYDIYCEKGYYDTTTQSGYFKQNAEILYNNKIIEGDSLFFENERNYAAASQKVIITDTINQSIIRGNYAEIYKAKDSAIITQRALAINIIENDSLYIHADTLVGTGPSENRILRAYYGVKILKKDLRGKSDSLYLDETKGRIELHQRPLSKKQMQILSTEEKNKRNPVMWFNESQMSGDVIYMKTDFETKKLDSLFIFGNAFIIEKDSLSENGYNQIVGKELFGDFENGSLNELDVVKNTRVLYYLYTDTGELVGIDKTICSALNIKFKENEIEDISFYVRPSGDVYPEKEIDSNLRRLEGFLWRRSERPETLEDLFKQED